MGMFDSIYLNIKCPLCKETSGMKAQTKDLDCYLKEYKLGDFVGTTEYKSLECITKCRSEKCLKNSNGTFGTFFNLYVFLEDGIINGKYKIIKNEY